MSESTTIHIALPVIDEFSQLPSFLEMLKNQTYNNFILHVCINQPEEWWDNDQKRRICLDNQESLGLLKGYEDFEVKVIDRSSQGKGWVGKKHGVGWARKTVMDSIVAQASEKDIIISLDADTMAGEGYISSVRENLSQQPKAVAVAVPYYHNLTGDPEADRAILRYELYMRNYNINLLRINSPYGFTALGSAMAFPVWAYKKIGGMTPVLSGEDFYFLQKMAKTGQVLRWNTEKVYPAARFSNRVYFGTGPAMEKGRSGDWESYPIYHHYLFRDILQTYEIFPLLYEENCETPMDSFLKQIFKEDNIWNSLRNNYKSESRFISACHSKIDGLRILQYLKKKQKEINVDDVVCLVENLQVMIPKILKYNDVNWKALSFTFTEIGILDWIRDRLVEFEESLQKQES